jgi:hypothetical protein
MNNLAFKKAMKSEAANAPIALVDQMDIKNSEDRSWFWTLLTSIFNSPDMDYSQFEYLESKKTHHQMKRNIWY